MDTTRTTETTTTIENYWVKLTARGDSTIPWKESWYLDCAATSHVGVDRRNSIWYTEYARRNEREIRDYYGRAAGKAIGHGDVRLRLRLLGY
jgi:hypothetical protein